MIVNVNGMIRHIDFKDNYRTLEVELEGFGITYQIISPSKEFNKEIGDKVSLYTSFQVREDSQILYGFPERKDRDFFEKLISVSGIGPKIGIAVLSMFSVDEVTRIIIGGDHKALSKAPGIGPKGAKKIILELAGILSVDDEEEQEESQQAINRELNEAMRTLGFKGEELKMMQEKGKEIVVENPGITIEELLQMVLRGE